MKSVAFPLLSVYQSREKKENFYVLYGLFTTIWLIIDGVVALLAGLLRVHGLSLWKAVGAPFTDIAEV